MRITAEENYRPEFTEETYWEFVERCKNTPRYAGSQFTASDKNDSWSGCKDLKTAFDMAVNGWDAGIEQLELEDGIQVSGETNFTPSVCGAVPNIGAYLQGLPEAMYDVTEEREYNLEPITIFVQLDYLADINAPAAFEFSKSVIKIVNKYQAHHNVKLVGIFEAMMRGNEVRLINHVIIKDYDARFVLNNIAFAFHPSFFRRVYFKSMETTPFCEHGYGGRYNTDQIERRLKAEGAIGLDKAILLPSLDKVRGGFTKKQIRELN